MRGLPTIHVVSPDAIMGGMEPWVALLTEAVASGGGLGFLPPLSRPQAESYLRQVAHEVEGGTRVVLAAHDEGELAGSAQLDLCQRPNGLHRAEVQKVMVQRRFRRRGIGRALMEAVGAEALSRGRTTLHLDTFADQDARRLYEATGWSHAGDIPAFARKADGSMGATSLYFRLLTCLKPSAPGLRSGSSRLPPRP